jgi:hypothetical protein
MMSVIHEGSGGRRASKPRAIIAALVVLAAVCCYGDEGQELMEFLNAPYRTNTPEGTTVVLSNGQGCEMILEKGFEDESGNDQSSTTTIDWCNMPLRWPVKASGVYDERRLWLVSRLGRSAEARVLLEQNVAEATNLTKDDAFAAPGGKLLDVRSMSLQWLFLHAKQDGDNTAAERFAAVIRQDYPDVAERVGLNAAR